jgi:hypothetical protein
MIHKTVKGKLIWRCRRCGSRDAITPAELAVKARIERSLFVEFLQQTILNPGNMVRLHECRDGGLGISDLQGGE